jgi:hypothetical protein
MAAQDVRRNEAGGEGSASDEPQPSETKAKRTSSEADEKA